MRGGLRPNGCIRLPDGWRWVRLGEVCELSKGHTPKEEWYSTSGVWLVRFRDVTNTGVNWTPGFRSRVDIRYASELRPLHPGTVLLTADAHDPKSIGKKVALVEKLPNHASPAYYSGELLGIRPRKEVGIIAEWVAFWLLSDEGYRTVQCFVDGVHLNVGRARDIPITLPPIPEQQRIVAILNEQMAAVERARAAAEERVEAARALPGAYLRATFGSPEAQKWPRKPLGVTSEIVGGIQKTPERMPIKFHKPYLTVRNVQRGYLDLSQVERFEVTPSDLSRLRLLPGDILIVEGNGSLDNIGRNALFIGDGEDWIHQNHIIRVRLSADTACPEFVSRFLNSDQGKSQMIEKAKTTSGLYTLSAGKVASLEVPVPPLIEQQRIAATLNEKMATADRVSKALEDELANIGALPAALLRRAFNGEL